MRHFLYILIFGMIVLFIGNNLFSLTDPDEVFYTGSAVEMLHQKTWITPYLFNQPQFEKPVLTYDLIRLGFNLFGETPFAARFFPSLFALIGALALFIFGQLLFKDKRVAFNGALILLSGGLYFGLGRTVFTDMIFSVLILLALLSFYAAYHKEQWKNVGVILFHLFAGLAVLTKGPLGYFLPLVIVVIYLFTQRDLRFLLSMFWLLGFIIFCLMAFPWYVLMFKRYGHVFINEFFVNDHWRRLIAAEHLRNDKWYFYPLAMVACMFPWTLLTGGALCSMLKNALKKRLLANEVFLFIWIAVVFVVFQAAHSKLISYILPLFPALALLTAFYWARVSQKSKKKLILFLWFTWGISVIFCAGLILAPFFFKVYISFSFRYIIVILAQLLFVLLLAFFIVRRKPLHVFLSLCLQVPLLFAGILYLHNQVEPFASTRLAADVLKAQPPFEGEVVCSKFLARGVRFYLQKDVAVFNIKGEQYFSSHPVHMLFKAEDLKALLIRQPQTYAILQHHDWPDFETMVRSFGKQAVCLKAIGDKTVVLVK